MKAIVSVIGKDHVGIIAGVCGLLSEMNINILDITQTILEDNFTMTMLVDIAESPKTFDDVASALQTYGEGQQLSIRIQREDIFTAMHRI